MRPPLARRFPVHLTLRVLPHVWNLRSRRGFKVVGRALAQGGERFGIRICEFSVQGNHLHLVAEAEDARSLSRGMQGFSIRVARGLNGMMRRRGKVLADRFHARILRSPTEVASVVRYVRHNRAVHRARWAARGSPFEVTWLGARPSPITQPTQPPPSVRADPYSSATRDHGIPLPPAHTYLLSRAQAEAT
jgi:REP element-mobilizing transposase RayT